MAVIRSPVFRLFLLICLLILLTIVGPAEKTLGTNVRVVYLHGAWVWAALVTLYAAGALGLVALLSRSSILHSWSQALGRVGILLWITYLPISMWAMQANWNGLYLSEPRWRVAFIFAVSGLLLQAGLTLTHRPTWTSAGNLGFIMALQMTLLRTQEVMHPPSPILDSESRAIQLFFGGMLIVMLLIAWQLALLWHKVNRNDNLVEIF